MAKQFINSKTSVILTANVILLSVLTCVWLTSKENKNRFQILAHTDSLTNIYNRYGFDELAAKMIAKNPKTHFVAALFDIDDFKFINDVYGHAYGDRALKSLTDSMKAFQHLYLLMHISDIKCNLIGQSLFRRFQLISQNFPDISDTVQHRIAMRIQFCCHSLNTSIMLQI